VRELLNTLQRVVVWSDGAQVTADDAKDAIISVPVLNSGGVLDQEFGDGFNIQTVLDGVAKHYLERAIATAKGNKTRAAELLGLGSYQTLTNWLKKYGIAASEELT
jgi:DNA-binding NtrC family response regulator